MPIQFVLAFGALLALGTMSLDASACQPPEAKPLRQQLNEAVGVVRAKVMVAKVRTVEDLGRICDAVNCDVLEISLEISEVFKGTAVEFQEIHAAVPTMCAFLVLPGWEYVFFLRELEGMVFPSHYSLPSNDQGYAHLLTELRRLKAE